MATKRLILLLSAGFLFSSGISVKSTEISKEVAFLAEVERNMAGIKTLQAEFVQERTVELLQNAIKFEGQFFIQKPDKIVWQVYRPVRYTCIITSNTITQWDADSRRKTVITAEANPALQLIFQQLSGWFAGKFNDLQKDFDYSGDIGEKLLKFTPKKGTPQENFIRSLSIFLHDAYIQKIKVVEKNGDTQTITFYKTVINETLPTNWDAFPE